VCAAVVALDQLSKEIVRDQIVRGDSVEVLPFLDLENTRNSGIAFGLGDGVPPALIALELAVLVGLLAFVALGREASRLTWLSAGLLVGGAVGNMIDRIRDDAVTDFIAFSFWPTFNVADMAIVAGVALLLLLPVKDKADPGDGA
jgi:signal peptidase II